MNNRSVLTVICVGLAGFLVGGTLVGYVDVYRPEPLFSRAEGGWSMPGLPECSGTRDQAMNYIRWVDDQPRPIRPDIWTGYQEEFQRISESLLSCVQSICAIHMLPVTQAHDRMFSAITYGTEVSNALDDARANEETFVHDVLEPAEAVWAAANEAYEEYLAALPQKPTAEQLEQLEQLEDASDAAEATLQAHEASHQVMLDEISGLEEAYTEATAELASAVDEWNAARDTYEETNCEEYLNFDVEPLEVYVDNEPDGTGGSSGAAFRASGDDASKGIPESIGVPAKSEY